MIGVGIVDGDWVVIQTPSENGEVVAALIDGIRACRRKLVDRSISHPQTVTDHGLRREVPVRLQTGLRKIISTVRRKNVG